MSFRSFLGVVSSRLAGRPLNTGEGVTSGVLLRYLWQQGLCLVRGGVAQVRISPRKWASLFLGSGVELVGLGGIRRGRQLRIGKNSKIVCWSKLGIVIGDRVSIGSNSYLSNGFNPFSRIGNVKIGNGVGIGEYFYLCCPSAVSIGDDTIAGQFLSIHPENHNAESQETPIRLQGVTSIGVVIGANCWIGAKVTILDGVELGPGCIVAAGAVVTKSFPANSVIAGVPARIIRTR